MTPVAVVPGEALASAALSDGPPPVESVLLRSGMPSVQEHHWSTVPAPAVPDAARRIVVRLAVIDVPGLRIQAPLYVTTRGDSGFLCSRGEHHD